MRERNLTLFILICYFTQGISQHFALASQPLSFYLKTGLNLDAFQISIIMSILMAPWVLKPFFGLLCDFFPLFGYRRLSYAIVSGCMTLVGWSALFLLVSHTSDLSRSSALCVILPFLLMATSGMAWLTALVVGLSSEIADAKDQSRKYFSLQGIVYYGTNIPAMALGGYLCQHCDPYKAISLAAIISALPCLILIFVSPSLLKSLDACVVNASERQSKGSMAVKEMRAALSQLAFNKAFMLTLAFLALWNFSPSLGTSLYFFEVDTLHFTQGQIGYLGAVTSAGMFVGSLIYRCFLTTSFQSKKSLYLLICVGMLSTLSYLLMATIESAVLIEFCRGICQMIFLLALYGLAADVAPKRIAVTAMAVIICFYNLAQELGIFFGGFLFAKIFAQSLPPLIMVSTVCTGLCYALVPKLLQSRQAVK